jgi:hypothetical protein
MRIVMVRRGVGGAMRWMGIEVAIWLMGIRMGMWRWVEEED